MDVRSAFLNGFMNEDVLVTQPKGYIRLVCPHHMYKLQKALCGLKQASQTWYDRLAKFYLNKAIVKGELIKLYLLNILVRVLFLLKSMWTTLSSVDLLRP